MNGLAQPSLRRVPRCCLTRRAVVRVWPHRRSFPCEGAVCAHARRSRLSSPPHPQRAIPDGCSRRKPRRVRQPSWGAGVITPARQLGPPWRMLSSFRAPRCGRSHPTIRALGPRGAGDCSVSIAIVRVEPVGRASRFRVRPDPSAAGRARVWSSAIGQGVFYWLTQELDRSRRCRQDHPPLADPVTGFSARERGIQVEQLRGIGTNDVAAALVCVGRTGRLDLARSLQRGRSCLPNTLTF